ncbi:MAG: hypothetical protein KKG92_14390 [Gammaproteobacteria bacterium]|nr:hypothetical protein [Gammaproteobacteria bacterium]
MKMLIKLMLLAVLMYSGALLADSGGPTTGALLVPTDIPTLLQACPAPSGQRIDTAQVSQSDCCKGHKGVCGCRAGKIVCCDNSASPSCTCHSDWGVPN